jgi:hypothetical protein
MADTSNAASSDTEEDTTTDTGDYAVEATEEAEISDRDVVVPLPLYKVITVFSTLIAGVAVVSGFVVLDEATQRASVPLEDIDPLLALLGLFMIAGGGAMYAFSGRFRAPGMGTTNTDEDEPSDNG